MRDVTAIGTNDALVITDGRKPQELHEALVGQVGRERLLAPAFLRISPRQTDQTGAERP